MARIFPEWTPVLPKDSKILVVGASGGLGQVVVKMLSKSEGCIIGAHGASKPFPGENSNILSLTQKFGSEKDCLDLVEEFVSEAGGIDGLVCLSGAIHFSGHWMDMPAENWEQDIAVNLNQPFYLARAAMKRMKGQGTGGRIVLNGTESALHGGSPVSFPYAIAKRGTECLVQGLAREGADDDILVNGVRLGYVSSGFHQRWHKKTEKELAERADMVLLKRAGDPQEAAVLIAYLLSGWAGFITGQMIPLTGGDWL